MCCLIWTNCPRNSPKKIIGVFNSSRPRDDLFGMYVRLSPHRDASGMFGLTLISFFVDIMAAAGSIGRDG